MEEILAVDFRSEENDVLTSIVDSGGRDVVKDIIGEDFNSLVIMDENRILISKQYRDAGQSHTGRNVFMNTDQGRELSEEFYNMFKELKKSLKPENIDDSKSMKNTHEERMEELAKRHDPYGELYKPVEHIGMVLVPG